MHELEPSREFNIQEPFVIRAHHLPIFRCLLQRSDYGDLFYSLEPVLSPKELTEQIRLSTLKRSNEYAHDVLGAASESADKVVGHNQKTYETFLTLPENHQVEIVEGLIDDICKGCIIGSHCRMDGVYKEDRRYLDPFVKAIDFIYSRKPSVTKGKVYFLDAEKPQEVRKVRTTMGIVRNVLATRPFEISDAPFGTFKIIMR